MAGLLLVLSKKNKHDYQQDFPTNENTTSFVSHLSSSWESMNSIIGSVSPLGKA